MASQTKKTRGSSNPPKGQVSSRAETSTSQTIYERQEVETRTQRNNGQMESVQEIVAGASGLAGAPFSRHQEKEELKYLNNRLAHYIDTIRAQEEEISVLRRKVEVVSSKELQENSKIKDRYNHEINNLRKALDEVSKDLAAATIERDALRPERDERISLENEKKNLQKKLKDADAALRDIRAQLAPLRDQIKNHDDEVNALLHENKNLKAQNESLKADLNRETNQRVDAENRLQSEREKNALLEGVHSEEMLSLRNQRYTEITEVETRMHDDYQSKMVQQLDELRADLEEAARVMREELEMSYQNQLEDVHNLAARNAADARALLADLADAQKRLKELQNRSDSAIKDLRAQVQRLQNDLGLKDDEVAKLQHLLSTRQTELEKNSRELSDQIRQYQELLDEKIQLDAELATYNALLKSEEKRLSLNSPPFPSTPDSQRRGAKRRADSSFTRTRFRNEASATGDVHICEIDAEGQFVRLENKSAHDVVVGGWQLHMRSNNGQDTETKYKIHTNQTIKGHATMTIWSANSNVVHDPPSDIVMEGRWLVGDQTTVTLSTPENIEVARREMARSSSAIEDSFIARSGLPKRQRLFTSPDSSVVTDGDQTKCIIM